MAAPPDVARRNGRLGGRPKGSKGAGTLAKEAAREYLRQQVTASLGPIVRAQTQAAIGLVHVFLRDAEGKWTRCLDDAQIEAALNSGDPNCYMLSVKDPSTPAAKDLLDRALDKPKEQAIEMQISGTLRLEDLVAEARKRVEKP